MELFAFLKVAGFEPLNFDYSWLVLTDRSQLIRPVISEKVFALENTRLRKAAWRHFKVGEELLVQGLKLESVQFVSYGVIQGARQVRVHASIPEGRPLGPAHEARHAEVYARSETEAILTDLELSDQRPRQ
jgi:hypothetical protein